MEVPSDPLPKPAIVASGAGGRMESLVASIYVASRNRRLRPTERKTFFLVFLACRSPIIALISGEVVQGRIWRNVLEVPNDVWEGRIAFWEEPNRPKKSILSMQHHRHNIKTLQRLGGAKSWF